MKALARIVGVMGVLVALVGVIGRGIGLKTVHMLGGGYAPRSLFLLGMLCVVIGTWLAVAFDVEKK